MRIISFISGLRPPQQLYAASNINWKNCLGQRRFRERFYRSIRPTLEELRRRQKIFGTLEPGHRNTYLDWNYDAEIYAFGERLGEKFKSGLLRQAFIERSYVLKQEDEQRKAGLEVAVDNLHNGDLMKKGEELIWLFSTQYLRRALPRLPEEGILSISNYLLSDDVISNLSFNIGTSELIFCLDFPVEKVTLANTFKAIVYALVESSGLDRATLFIRDFVITQIAEQNVNDLWSIENPIGVLYQILKNEGIKETPEPRIIGEAAMNTLLACYRVGLYLNKQMIGLGSGESVDTAYEMAARDTLRRLFHTTEAQLLIPFDLILKPQLQNQIPNVSIMEWCEESLKKHQQLVNSKSDRLGSR